MLRLINCQHATLLLEQQADNALTGVERRSLALHVLYCPYCKRYSQQTVLIAQLARAAATAEASAAPGLPEAAKVRLRELLR